MCKKNQVVIYSNGIADFQRCYEVGPESPEKISIPVRQDHLADVLASFNVYGNVKLDSPPTFRPSNELEGNITINPQKALEDLATNLSGAKVRVERASGAIEGTLVGLHQEEEATAGEPIHPKSIIVLTDEGLRRCVLREIQSFKFLDEDVQTEIDKALQRNYQRIKPNSTFVELVLSAAKDKSEAIVQYTIPAAAWKTATRRVKNRTGYSHQWRRRIGVGLKNLCMASADSESDVATATARGWRTFRVRKHDAPTLKTESICPASKEGGQRTQCDNCGLCQGATIAARSIVIADHGLMDSRRRAVA